MVTSVVLLNNTVKDSCPYGAHAFWDHICAIAPCLTSRVVFSVSPWRPHNPHNLNTSERNQKLSPSPDMASFPHHSFTQLNHLVLSLHLLSTLLQAFSRMSLLLCISHSLSTGSSPSLTETSAKASHLASLSLASFLLTLFLSHHYCQILFLLKYFFA